MISDASALEFVLYLTIGLVIGHGIGIPLGIYIAKAVCGGDWLWPFRRER